jgi:DAACS family dicarboxylate/amino acid:cation (Na+ or H+) symporter
MLALTTFNAVCALVIGVGLTTWLEPGKLLTGLSTTAKDWKPPVWSFDAWVKGLVPKSVFDPFTDNAILPLALCGVAVAVALRRSIDGLAEDRRADIRTSAETWLAVAQGLFQTMLGWVVELAPIAVAGVVAKSVGENGLSALKGLWAYLGVGALGLSLQVGVVYLAWVRWSGVPLRAFWRAVKRPVANAVGTNSSLATLPLTLEALDELGVSKEASTLGACVGTNLNNDGILLYEAMAVLMVAQATGVPLGLGAKLGIVGLCWVATVGIAGVPEAGIISLSIVLAQAGLPLELLPVLLSVDWILARLRSVTNVVSDIVTSLVLDRWMRAAPRT